MEITRNNFSEELENITNTLNKSCFVGFDAEFTSILSGECFQHRLFDTNKERYDKIKNEVSKMMMTQVGLTMFHYNRDQDTYIAYSYTFHLCPQVFGDINQSFIFQASTLRFLCQHNFDFNKFTYNGLPYISKAEEAHIRKQLNEKTLLNNLIQSLEMADEKILQGYCSEVAKWLVSSNEDTIYLDIDHPVMRYIVHCELRNRFPDVLTTNSLGNSHKVLIYRDKNIDGANNASMATLEENLMNYVLGFSKIIQLLATFKKPIIGHNIFLDIVLLHNQFIGNLPKNYSTFKKNIINLFPTIYDTKYISHEMGRKLTLDEIWKSNALQDLYEFFSEGKCKKLQKGINLIKLNTPFDVKQSYHEAGWDSYCTGYCFIRLGEWSSRCQRGVSRPVSPGELSAALAPYRHKVNVIRGAVTCMVLIYRDKNIDGANNASMATLEENLMNYVLGFSKIIQLLATFKKPIIGHNIFLDIVLLHNQFIGNLPKNYSTFKKNIINLFPTIYDTKYISHEMGRKLTLDEIWKSNALQDLYEFFSEGKCKKLQKGINLIKLNTPFDVKQSYHEAGWDSYCTGYCFIRLGEWSSRCQRGVSRPVSPGELSAALAPYRHKVNVIRGAVTCMNLMDDDPPSHRPGLLHIRSVREPVINITQVSSLLASFGSLDVKPYGKRTALIAAGSQHTADKLLKHFKIHKDYRITPYKSIRHSGRLAIWGGAILTGSIFLYFIHRRVNK